MTYRYTCIDAFCGAGGLSLGLERAGFHVIAAFDSGERAIETYQRNLGAHGFVARVEELSKGSFRAVLRNSRLDLLAGGPPCQGFSKQKRGAHLGDLRNDLVLEFSRLVRDLSPRTFLLENVDQLGKKRGRGFLTRLGRQLRDYVLYPHFYNSADYGLAQTRVRYVIVGKHKTLRAPFAIPRPTAHPWRTVGEVLVDLPEPPRDYSDHPDLVNHYRAKVTQRNVERFSYVPEGGGWWHIPEELQLRCHRRIDRRSGGWPDVYGRLEWNGQCPTITAGFDSFTRGRYGHPHADRPLTPREAARLQGFPDAFAFTGTRFDIRSQIGNAVPPPLAEVIGRAILQSLLVEDGVVDSSTAIAGHPRTLGEQVLPVIFD